jgi:hypothetical protein
MPLRRCRCLHFWLMQAQKSITELKGTSCVQYTFDSSKPAPVSLDSQYGASARFVDAHSG